MMDLDSEVRQALDAFVPISFEGCSSQNPPSVSSPSWASSLPVWVRRPPAIWHRLIKSGLPDFLSETLWLFPPLERGTPNRVGTLPAPDTSSSDWLSARSTFRHIDIVAGLRLVSSKISSNSPSHIWPSWPGEEPRFC